MIVINLANSYRSGYIQLYLYVVRAKFSEYSEGLFIFMLKQV